MTRPRKQNVDYFPHYCKHGKVLFVLESKYGNDGYAFFYKLLEALGDADGHFIDCSKPEHLEYLTAVSGAKTPQSVTDILNTLSIMSIIDQKLWAQRIIWMQSFVDSIADVYAKRKQSAPVMPLLTPETQLLVPEKGENPLPGTDNPQRIVKDRIVKDSKEEREESPPFPSQEIKEPKKKTIPPLIEDVISYCRERKNNIDPEAFMSFYESNGWMVGKNKMKDWKAAIITWEKRDGNGYKIQQERMVVL